MVLQPRLNNIHYSKIIKWHHCSSYVALFAPTLSSTWPCNTGTGHGMRLMLTLYASQLDTSSSELKLSSSDENMSYKLPLGADI
jgi:hypothetical protein